jgi:hypothetical protein
MTQKSGRRYVNLKGKGRRIHRLVLQAFVGPCPAGQECCHGDGDPSNNVLSNLRWGTRSDNRRDSVGHGTHFSTSKKHCPRRHPLREPNLVPSVLPRRNCLACARARNSQATAQNQGREIDFQEVADMHYQKIMNLKAML